MLTLSAAAKQLKNSLIDAGVWLSLITFTNKNASVVIRVVNNTEDIVFAGNTYTAFPIQVAEITESNKGELPTISISLSNVSRAVEGYIEQDPDLGSGWSVHVDIVHTSSVASGVAEVTYDFVTVSVTADTSLVTFSCGLKNPIRQQFPRLRFLPNSCQNTFKQGACTYSGTAPTCVKTLKACRAKFVGQSKIPFLGFPGIPGESIYV